MKRDNCKGEIWCFREDRKKTKVACLGLVVIVAGSRGNWDYSPNPYNSMIELYSSSAFSVQKLSRTLSS